MKEFTYSEARQQLATLLEKARRDGAVRIRRRDGQIFVVRPESGGGSPLDVPSLKLDVSRAEILAAIRDGRRPA